MTTATEHPEPRKPFGFVREMAKADYTAFARWYAARCQLAAPRRLAPGETLPGWG